MLAILLAASLVTTGFSQPNNQRNNGYDNSRNNTNWNARPNDDRQQINQRNDSYNRNNRQNETYYRDRNGRQYSERDKQAELNRINSYYDAQERDYRNNRNMREAERNQRIRSVQAERNSKIKSFSSGLIVGGLLGLLIGSSH